MILKHLLLSPDSPDSGGGDTPIVPATPSVAEMLNATKPQPLQKPQSPRPPTDAEKKLEFSMDADIADTIPTEPPSKEPVKEPAPKVEPVKTEPVKAELPKTVKEPAKEEPAKTEKSDPDFIAVSKPTGTFDYTGHSPEEVTILKNMSNQSREHVSKLMKQAKQLENEIKSASFLQHPEAYQLDPAYKSLQEDRYFNSIEAEYWKNQLNQIKAGENWRPVIKWNKDGTPVLGDERPPTSEHEEMVRQAMNECYQLAQSSAGKMQEYAQAQKQRFIGDLQAINAEQQRRFEWVADPSKLEHKIEIPNLGTKTIGEIRNDFIGMFPSYHRNTAGVDVAANLFVAVQILSQRLRAAEGEKQVAQTRAEEVRRAEPTSTVRPASQKEVRGIREFSLSGMPS